MAYNIKVLKYPTGYQVRVYSVPVDNPMEGAEDLPADDMYYDPDTRQWERVERRKQDDSKWEICPFTGERVRVQTDLDWQRSQRVSLNRTVNRLYYLARSNYWDWFVTLTFDPEKVDRYDYSACVKKLSLWLNNCRKKCSDMGYLVVPEQHKDGAWHFHGLFSNCDGLGFVNSGKRDEDGKPIYNIGAYKLGFTTATKVVDLERVSKYICKYVTKDLCAVTFGKKRYWASKNLVEAETEEFLLEPAQKQEFLLQIADYIKHGKTTKGAILNVNYFELENGVDIDAVNS